MHTSKTMREKVNCKVHGRNEACMICSHLIKEEGKAFAKVLVRPEDEDYETAMCVDCETLLLDDGEWSEELEKFAEWKLFCRKCYENTIKKHELVAEGYMS